MTSTLNGANGVNGGVEPSQPVFIRNISTDVPEWVSQEMFVSVLKKDIGDYEKIVSFTVGPALKPGENYLSAMMRVTIEVEVIGGGPIKTVSYILKTNHNNVNMSAFLDLLLVFPKEQEMYESIIPQLESLYKDAGKIVSFAPQSYKFAKNTPVDYLLLEDVCRKNFRNANRLEGLDMIHMKHVLTKLAEFHAASACLQERNGNYSDKFITSIFTEKNRDILLTLNKPDLFLSNLKKWKNCEQYAEKLADFNTGLVDRIINEFKINTSEFNVLNHGDLWSNNIMFQYDAFGKIKETYFIDFQIGKYGRPTYDLYYIILTSAKMDIKLTQFDYMVKFYHDILIENLKLLEYHRPLPKLRNIHMSLFKSGLSAFIVVAKILPVVMLDVDALNTIDAEEEEKMYRNPNYVRAMEAILPWLDNRGLLDCN